MPRMPETTPTDAPVEAVRQPWKIEAAWVLLTGLVTLVVTVLVFHLWHAAPQLPFFNGATGDWLVNATSIKAMLEHGWFWSVPELGAPNGLQFFDFPLFFGDNLHFGLMKFMSIFSQNTVLIYNAFVILGFPISAMAAFGVQRDLGIGRPVALVFGFLFAMLPYHFGPTSAFQVAYYAVPLVVWLTLVVVLDRPVWTRRGRWHLPTAKVAIAVIVICGASVYWMAFCAVLIVVLAPMVALVRRNPGVLGRGVAIVGMLAALTVVTQIPSLAYQAREGKNPVAAARLPIESEMYGLKLADLLIPSNTHRVPILAEAGTKYLTGTSLKAEGVSYYWLGLIGTVGFFIALTALLRWGLRTEERLLLPALGIVVLVALLVSWTGGISSLIAWFLTPQIRGWGRMTVIIGFASLLAVAVVLDGRVRRWERGATTGRRLAIGAGLIALMVVGRYDQLPTILNPPDSIEAAKRSWRAEVRYTAAVVDRLPKRDASVLQLPYISFPEHGPEQAMADYEQLRPYLQTSAPVRWSGGAMKGRSSDWGSQIANWTPDQLVERAAAAGFDAIWIDRRAYTDRAVRLAGQISTALDGQQPFGSPDGNQITFDLQPELAKLATEPATDTPAERRALGDELVEPVSVVWSGGFSTLESRKTDEWRWLGATGTLRVGNDGNDPMTATITGRAFRATVDGKATISVTAPASCAGSFPVALEGTEVTFRCTIPPGGADIAFAAAGPDVPVTAAQPRPNLRVRLAEPRVTLGPAG